MLPSPYVIVMKYMLCMYMNMLIDSINTHYNSVFTFIHRMQEKSSNMRWNIMEYLDL